MTVNLRHVRQRCREVAAQAIHVSIDVPRLREYAAALAPELIQHPNSGPHDTYEGELEDVVAFVLILDTINFGSGYSPWLRNKRDNSLYYTVASGIKERFLSRGAFRAEDLVNLTISEVGGFIPLEGAPEVAGQLLKHFTEALNELGRFTVQHFDGALDGIVQAAKGSAERLVALLTEMASFNDVAQYGAVTVPFYKRAQLTVADLWMRLGHTAYGNFRDMAALTAFADNAVPHVLRTDGILVYDEHLDRLIADGTLIRPASMEEVEIRAATIAAVDSIVEEIRRARPEVTDVAVDVSLWTRAHRPAYASLPRHLTQTVFY